MIQFKAPYLLVFILFFLIFVIYLYIKNKKIIKKLKEKIYKNNLYYFTLKENYLFFLLILILINGVVLSISIAGPYTIDKIKTQTKDQYIYFFIDCSLSMIAEDVINEDKEKTSISGKLKDSNYKTRLDYAKLIAKNYADRILKENFGKIGVFSYAGTPFLHLTPEKDRNLVLYAIQNIHYNYSYRTDGSSLKQILKKILYLKQYQKKPIYVIIIGDGEIPNKVKEEIDFSEELKFIKVNKIKISTIGVGSEKGVKLSIFDPLDVIQNNPNPKIQKTIHTKREDKFFEEIASETNGIFYVAEDPKEINTKILKQIEENTKDQDILTYGSKDLNKYFFLLFGFLFLIEILFFHFVRYIKLKKFNLINLIFILIVLNHCNFWKAHIFNEKGIENFNKKQIEESIQKYQTSASYRFMSQIPIQNSGISYAFLEKFQEGNQSFLQAIQLSPEESVLYYNYGVFLYYWGKAEVDLENCNLEDTKKLWENSLKQFEIAIEKENQVYDNLFIKILKFFGKEIKSEILRRSRENALFIAENLKNLEKLKKMCKQNQNQSSSSQDQNQNENNQNQSKSSKNQVQNNQNSNQNQSSLTEEEKKQIEQKWKELQRGPKGKFYHKNEQTTEISEEEGKVKDVLW